MVRDTFNVLAQVDDEARNNGWDVVPIVRHVVHFLKSKRIFQRLYFESVHKLFLTLPLV